MADALDLGFNWQDGELGKPNIFDFGFASNDSGVWKKRPGSSDTIDAAHFLYFRFFEVSETSNVGLLTATISFKLTQGDVRGAVNGWTENDQGCFEVFTAGGAMGLPCAHSAGLGRTGSGWSFGPLAFNSELTKHACHYEVSLIIQAMDLGSAPPQGPIQVWWVDPEMIVGPRG